MENQPGYKIKKEAVEAILAGTGLKTDPAVVDLLLELGYDVNQPPAELDLLLVNRFLEILAGRFFPELPRTEAMLKLGNLTFEGYLKSMAGKILLAAIEVWGPGRLVFNSPQVYRAALKYGDRTVREVAPNRWEMLFLDEPAHVEFLGGVIVSALEASGAVGVKLAVNKLAANEGKLDYRLEIEWESVIQKEDEDESTD